MLDEFTKSIKQKIFSIPELPIFIEKNSIRDSINENCCLYSTQKSKKINEGEYRMSVKAKKRCESDQNDLKDFSMFYTTSTKFTKIPQHRNDCIQAKIKVVEEQKRVKLVDKLKGKMKMNSILNESLFI